MLPLRPYSTYVRKKNHLGRVVYNKHVIGFRQEAPYTVNTTMESYTYRLLSGMWYDADSWSWNDNSDFKGTTTAATNKARAKFVQKLGDSSSFGATLTAERKETWALVVSLITKCALAAKQVSRMQLLAAAKTLGLPYSERTVRTVRYRRGGDSTRLVNGVWRRRGRRYISRHREMNWGQGWHYRTAASGWLMWSYGVKPLASDIYNGMDVLQRPTPELRVRGFGRADARESTSSGNHQYWGKYLYEVSVTVGISADVRVNNPNLWLLNKLGLVNPAQWINEAIPFSFVADWFSNLSQVISQMTDFVGLTVSNPVSTRLSTCRETFTNYDVPYNYSKEAKIFRRTLEIPTAKLQFAYERFEWQRGLNAISLLIGFLPKGR